MYKQTKVPPLRPCLDSKGSNDKLIDDQKEDVAEGHFLDTQLSDSVALIQNNLSSNSWAPIMCQMVWMSSLGMKESGKR